MNSEKSADPGDQATLPSGGLVPRPDGSAAISPEVEEDVAEQLRKVLGDVGAPTLSGVLAVVERTVSREIHSGPLPSPRQLAAYKEVGDDFAERIVSMAEREQGHRHSVERKVVNVSVYSLWVGLVLGFIVSLGLMAGAYFSGKDGNTVVACAFLAASAIGMVSVFVKAGSRLGIIGDGPEEPEEIVPQHEISEREKSTSRQASRAKGKTTPASASRKSSPAKRKGRS